jgi:HK97 family phage major capsid protein
MLETVHRLRERRAGVVTQMQELDRQLRQAEESGEGEDELQQKWNALKALVEQIDEQISRRALLDEYERRASGQPLAGAGDRRLDEALGSFWITRAIGGAIGLPGVDWGRERELGQELARRSGRGFGGIPVPLSALRVPKRGMERRVISTSSPSGGPGSNLISEIVDGEQMIDALRAALVIRRLGARIISGLTSNVDLPRLNQTATAGWVAENSALTVSDEGFDHIPLRPKHAGGIVELSRNMLMQPSIDLEMWARRDLAEVLARVLDSAAINGTGSSNDPTGILNTTGIGSVAVGTNGGPMTYNLVQDLRGQVADANAELGENMAFLSNTKVRRAASKITDSYGHPLGLDLIFSGLPQAYTNLVPSNGTKGTGSNLSTLIYGNFGDLVIGLWSELDVLVNPYETTAYTKGNVQIRAMLTCDIGLRHPQSFAAIVDIAA